jgi:hypothetical protein
MSAQPARTGEPARLDESAHDGTTAGRTSDRADTAEAVRLARVRANAIADAEALLGLEAARCDPEDFERLRRRLAELHRGGSVDEVRRTLTDLTAGMAHAVNRWKRAAQVEQARVELCDQLQDALPEEREDLLAAVRSAAEPDSLRGLVANALARADRARSRLAVAAAVTETLRGMQYEVGEEFGDILAETGVGVVTFTLDELTGYGLRIQLPRDGGPLGTAVVRRSDADPARDRYVQQRFCDEHLTVFERGLQRGGVNLTPRGRVQPGMLPAPPVPSDGWPPPARERPRRGPKRRSGSAGAAQHQQDAARERSRER